MKEKFKFIRLTVERGNEIAFNVSRIIYLYPTEKGKTVIKLMDDVAFEVEESYETVLALLPSSINSIEIG